MTRFHPDLSRARYIPPFSYGPRSVRATRWLLGRQRHHQSAPAAGVVVSERVVPGLDGRGTVSMRVMRPGSPVDKAPTLLWVHGGGLVFGIPEQDDPANAEFVRRLGITVASVRYRLAPEHRAPAAVEDAYAAFLGLVGPAAELGVDPARIAVGGASAGGGIAAALAQLAHDRGGVQPVFQLLVYPMLDDRTVTRTDLARQPLRMWTPKSNRLGWTAYLGAEPGAPDVPQYAVPARRPDLTGLPPAWIGVGTLDLFHAEDVEYARRLTAAGVPCELLEVPGAFHGFDALLAAAEVSKDFLGHQVDALDAGLRLPATPFG